MKQQLEISANAAVTNAPPPVPRSSSVLPWLGLISILLLYALCVVRIHPTNFFGLTEDDSIYFSSAKALAEGKGYILPSVPGMPPATKYPILYPWMLSWVWRWNPSFPANLSVAVALNVFFGFVFLTMAFVFLRRLKGLNDTIALLLTAFCALHPLVLFCSADLMADIPFAALTLAAIVLTTQVIEQNKGTAHTLASGMLTGSTLLIRVVGAPVAVGLCLAIALRRGWRHSSIFAGSVLPFILYVARSSIAATPTVVTATQGCGNEWRMTWLYYMSYLGFWKADVLPHHVFWQCLKQNFFAIVMQSGAYFLDTRFIQPLALAAILLLLFSAIAIRGIVRLIEANGWQPLHFACGMYLLPLLLWNYGRVGRFLIPFLPLIAAGPWMEGRHLARQIRTSLSEGKTAKVKLAAAFVCLAGMVFIVSVFISIGRGTAEISQESQRRAALLSEKQEAYSWLRENTSSSTRFIAYEDASAFLYSARQGMRPTIFLPAGGYRPEVLNSDLACLTSSAAPIGARYWIIADDDFGFEWEPARSRGKSRESEMQAALPLLFRSRQGHVSIYGLVPGDD